MEDRKPFYKRWWFWLAVLLLLIGLFSLRGNLARNAAPAVEQATE